MFRRVASAFVGLSFVAAFAAHADVTVGGAIFRNDVPGFLADFQAGPLNSVGRGVNYERTNINESILGNTACGGGPGFVYSRSFAQYRLNFGSPGSPGGFSLTSNSEVNAVWSDIVVSGPAGPANVPFSFNVLLEGNSILGSVGPNGTAAAATASFSATINTVNVASGVLVRTAQNGGPDQTPIANGVFTAFTGSTTFATSSVMVPVNTPITITVQLSTSARDDLNYEHSGTTTSLMNFGNTASLSTSGPAFNVPAGYTVNSPQARVRNNVFTLCYCDWDGSGVINSQDFFNFLTDFFALNGDFNHDGDTSSQDFFDFLGCFFAGCP